MLIWDMYVQCVWDIVRKTSMLNLQMPSFHYWFYLKSMTSLHLNGDNSSHENKLYMETMDE